MLQVQAILFIFFSGLLSLSNTVLAADRTVASAVHRTPASAASKKAAPAAPKKAASASPKSVAPSASTKTAPATPTAAAPVATAANDPAPEVQWFPIENEKSAIPGYTRVVLSGLTSPEASVQIDGESVSVLKSARVNLEQKIESVQAKATGDGFFEIGIDLPRGLLQIPVMVTASQTSRKTFLLTFEVAAVKEQIAVDTKTSKQKPPAAAKRFRFWAGAGWTYQSFNQTSSDASDLKFQTIQAPGLVFRSGYWGERWGADLYFRDAPGKIEADAPLQVATDSYHWQTAELKGLYQFERNARSRMLGLASQWQLRFGVQQHQLPFLDTKAGNQVSLEKVSLTTGSLGVGLLLGQEQKWTYEFALGVQYPLSVAGPGSSFQISKSPGFEAQIGAAYKFAPQWRLGVFSYTQSLSYSYEYTRDDQTLKTGNQSIFDTTFDLRLGYEF